MPVPRRIIYRPLIIGVLALLAIGLGLACQEPDLEPHIALLKSMQPEVREKAAGKLVIYAERAVPRLIEETGSEYTRVRFEVARILGRIRDPRAIEALIRLLDDRSYNVASYAAWGLGEMRAADAVHELLRFPETPAKMFRQQVVWALGQCYSDSVHADLRDSVRHVVERALLDPTPGVRVAALQSARHLGYPDMTDQLIRMSRDPAAEVRHVAVQALGQVAIGDAPRATGPVSERERRNITEALLTSTEESHQAIRTKAVRALERMGPPPQVGTVLLRLLAKGTAEDQREARRVLEKLTGTEVVDGSNR